MDTVETTEVGTGVFIEEEPPLHQAVKSSNLEAVENILQNGGDVNYKGFDGNTPLHIALLRKYDKATEMCTLLLEGGANVELVNNRGYTSLLLAIIHNPDCVFPILARLPQNQAVNFPYIFGNQPLCYVTKISYYSLKILLDNDAVIDFNNSSVNISRHFASRCKMFMRVLCSFDIEHNKEFMRIYKTIVSNGIDVNIDLINGKTALHHTVQAGCKHAKLELLLDMGADVNIRDNDGKTPLHYFCVTSVERMYDVNILLDWGASPSIKDLSGNTPLDIYPEIADGVVQYNIRKACLTISGPLNVEGCSTYQTACLRELDRLKLDRYGKHSLYDIFCQYSDPRFLLNEALEEAVSIRSLKYSYPIYSSLLKSTYKKAKVRLKLLKDAADTLQSPLPRVPMWHILTFVDDDTLQNLLMTKERVEDPDQPINWFKFLSIKWSLKKW